MWTRDGRRAVGRRLLHAWAVVAVIYAGSLLAGCAEAGAPSVDDVESASSATREAVGAEPATLADLFPEARGRRWCSTRAASATPSPAARSGSAPGAVGRPRGGPPDKASNLSEENLETIFAYLSEHFNDSRPEPRVPPRFLEAGCTPF